MRIGIIGAMDVEVELLKENIDITEVKTVAGQEYVLGTIGKQEVVIVKCGVGKVRAALAVQVLKDVFDVTHVINTGVAGSLNNDINIGDIVVSKDAVFHDVDASIFGYALGEVPQMGRRFFESDPSLMEQAYQAIKESTEVQAFIGRVASGDQFISTKDKKEWIRENFAADCTEMEGCAIAEAAYVNQIPYVIIRAISDKADESVQVSYDEFEGLAAKHCAKVVLHMISKM